MRYLCPLQSLLIMIMLWEGVEKMKKMTLILTSLLVFFLVQSPILAEETDKSIIKYEKDGRVKPIPEANLYLKKI